MIYRVDHETTYEYPRDVSMSHNLAHLTARPCARQTCLSSAIDLSVAPAARSTNTDYFGNPVTYFTIQEPHRRLRVLAVNVVEVHPAPLPDPGSTPPWEEVARMLREPADAACAGACQYIFDSPYVKRDPALAKYAGPSFTAGRPLLEAVLDFNHRIYQDFTFDPRATTIATPPTEVLQIRRGVCQDFAHLLIGCLRSIGLAARYVSGYLRTTPPPGKTRLIGADASHAWASVYCPGTGWVDLDPTNDVVPGLGHILLAWGRDYDDVSPIRGVILGGGRHSIKVGVDVVPVEVGTAG